MFAKIVTDKAPVIVVEYVNDSPTSAEIDEFLKELKALYEKRMNMLFVTDSRKIKYMPSEVRIKLGLFLKENLNLISQYNKGNIFITNSIVASAFIKGVFLIQKPPYPYYIFTNEEQAWNKVNELLKNL
jgi:hypothetical protein